jgi:hypothetical protein
LARVSGFRVFFHFLFVASATQEENARVCPGFAFALYLT